MSFVLTMTFQYRTVIRTAANFASLENEPNVIDVNEGGKKWHVMFDRQNIHIWYEVM